MIRTAISKVVDGTSLTEDEMILVMDQIMSGNATPAQISAFITALRMKGETVEEITGAARVMRRRATTIPILGETLDMDRPDRPIEYEPQLDVVGTGGDGTNTFNISTTVALVTSACGVKVAKHGNRSVSSACGSADVLEALGVDLNVTPEIVGRCLSQIGIGFLYAPALHGAMKHAIGPRREIGIRTIFNILGPLTNPAGAEYQVMGVYRQDQVDTLARVLQKLGCRHGYVVHGSDGMDEITLTGPTYIAEILPDNILPSIIRPEMFDLFPCTLDELRGGNARDNAAIVQAILGGETGPKRDVVLLNAAYGLMAANRTCSPQEGILLAKEAIDSRQALRQLEKLVSITNSGSID
jgi:anthranilate phosphoribosyltransferase